VSATALFGSEFFTTMRQLGRAEWSDSKALKQTTQDDVALCDLWATAWKAAVGADLSGAAVPEDLGGIGLSLAQLVDIVAAAGATLFPQDLVFQALLPALLLRRLPRTAATADLLSGLAAGSRISVAILADGREDPDCAGEQLSFVHGLQSADRCLVVDEKRGVLSVVDPVDLTELVAVRVLDGRDIAVARLPRAAATALADGGADAGKAQASHLGALLAAADSLGAAQTALDRAIEYAKTRHQFGSPIGSFQAVKHAIVDRYVDLEIGRALLRAAADKDTVEPVAAAMLKASVNESSVASVNTAIQTHGAIGFTTELGLHLYQRRVLVNRALFLSTEQALAVVRGSLGIAHRAETSSPSNSGAPE
jgi:alkylation response protein AidB-like acyl-CoA dehydrogenase